jgi:hypothetical protein
MTPWTGFRAALTASWPGVQVTHIPLHKAPCNVCTRHGPHQLRKLASWPWPQLVIILWYDTFLLDCQAKALTLNPSCRGPDCHATPRTMYVHRTLLPDDTPQPPCLHFENQSNPLLNYRGGGMGAPHAHGVHLGVVEDQDSLRPQSSQ